MLLKEKNAAKRKTLDGRSLDHTGFLLMFVVVFVCVICFSVFVFDISIHVLFDLTRSLLNRTLQNVYVIVRRTQIDGS